MTNNINVGIKYKGGLMIAADIRPNCLALLNIHRLQDNIYAAVTGVGQDTSFLVSVIRAKLQLHHMATNFRRVPVRCANQITRKLLHSQSGNMNVNVLMGGVDTYGTTIYSTRFDGSSDTVPFTAIGSGVFYSMAVLETGWRIDMDEASARKIIYEAVIVAASKTNPQSPVRLCTIKNDYSVVMETLGAFVTAPMPQGPTLWKFVPKVLHEKVERLGKIPKRWKTEYCAAEEKEEESGVEQRKEEEKIDEGGDK